MSINLTMIGQMVSFVIFVWFCMKFVWPPLTQVLRERQKLIAAGLENASKAEQQLQQANEAVGNELEAAKREANDLINQARNRASQIVEEAKSLAKEEAEKIVQGAQGDIDLEINRAREELRQKVSELAITGAEKILQVSIDRSQHDAMLIKLAAEL